MESRGINPLETKLGEGKLNTGKEGAPQNRGEGEELVLSSWEVSHAPYAPLPPPRVTDRLFAVSRGRHWKPVPIPWGNRGPKETRDCLRSPSSPASGPRELPQHSCNSPHHLCMPSTVPGQRGTQPRAGLDGTDTVNKEGRQLSPLADGEPGAQGRGTREVVEEGGGPSPGPAPGPHGSLATMQAAAHSIAPAQREEEPGKARGKAKPQETAGQVVREEPPSLPSPPLFCRWGC